MDRRPRVSFIITAFDSARTLGQAVQSVLDQDGPAIELIVVDDASQDRTPQLLAAIRDPRLRVIRNRVNVGPFAAASRALDLARGDYVARLDADDLCLPARTSKQLAFLHAHRQVGIVGSMCRQFDEQGTDLGLSVVQHHDLAIRWHLLLRSPFVHSTVMMRRRVLERHGLRYDPTLRVGGDYQLWTQLLRHTHGANLKSALVRYRVWPGSITGSQRAAQRVVQDRVSQQAIAEALPGFAIDAGELSDLRQALVPDPHRPVRPHFSSGRRAALCALYRRLFEAFNQAQGARPGIAVLRRQVERRARQLAIDGRDA